MLERFCQRELGCPASAAIGGRKVVVLGTGGASEACRCALTDVGGEVVRISRTGSETYATLVERHADAVLVVNTTPVGTYPNCPASPLAPGVLEGLGGLRGVLDVVYNPERTGLMLEAERLGLPHESGLAMLVAQALFSSELFQGRALKTDLIERIESGIRRDTRNVILIGMPCSGKTSCGRRLARMCRRPFVDLDDSFEVEHQITPADCIRERGEDAFRALETETARANACGSGLVIATGGGIVTRPDNYPILHQNATIIMLDRPLNELSSDNRPLSLTKGIEQLAAERMGLYRSWADIRLECTGSAAGDAVAIRQILGI
jgi:shikimate dehydrogenase